MMPVDPSRRGWLIAAALLASAFVAGALSGAAVISVLNRDERASVGSFPRDPMRGRRPGIGPRPGGLWRGEMMAERLGLTDEQEEAVREILVRGQVASDSIMAGVFPELRAALDSTLMELRAVLSPEQLEEFQRFRREGREGLFRRFPGPPGEGGRRPRW